MHLNAIVPRFPPIVHRHSRFVTANELEIRKYAGRWCAHRFYRPRAKVARPSPPHSLRHACLSRCRTDRVRAPPGRKTIDSRACILAVSPPFSKSFFLTRGCTRVPPYFAREEGKGEREKGGRGRTFYFIMPASVIGIARRDRNRGPSRCGGPFKSIRNVGEMRILIIYRGQPTVADFFFFLFSFFF